MDLCPETRTAKWKYTVNDVNSYKIGGNSHVVCDTMEPYLLGGAAKGGGSAYGGKWRPSKEDDKRFVGSPGSINRTVDAHGNLRETKIGEDGRAI